MQPGELKEKAVSSDQPTQMIIVAAVQIKMIETRQLYILNVKYSVRGRIYWFYMEGSFKFKSMPTLCRTALLRAETTFYQERSQQLFEKWATSLVSYSPRGILFSGVYEQ